MGVKFNNDEQRLITCAYNEIKKPEKQIVPKVQKAVRRKLGWKMPHMLHALDLFIMNLHLNDVVRDESQAENLGD